MGKEGMRRIGEWEKIKRNMINESKLKLQFAASSLRCHTKVLQTTALLDAEGVLIWKDDNWQKYFKFKRFAKMCTKCCTL